MIKSICNKIYYYIEDTIFPGMMISCPNCSKRIILSFPNTTCTFCNNVFRNSNNIKPIYKKHHYSSKPIILVLPIH